MTREEAIAELSVLHERLSNPKDCEDGIYDWEDGWYVEAIDIAIKALEQTRWIPCSERLPDEREERYWCCSEGGYQFQCRWTNDMYGLCANEYSKWGWHVMDKPQYSRVIAWMPLPEVYRGEDE